MMIYLSNFLNKMIEYKDLPSRYIYDSAQILREKVSAFAQMAFPSLFTKPARNDIDKDIPSRYIYGSAQMLREKTLAFIRTTFPGFARKSAIDRFTDDPILNEKNINRLQQFSVDSFDTEEEDDLRITETTPEIIG